MSDFMDRALKTMRFAEVMKRKMKEKGIRAAKAKCPYCAGFWHGRLAGTKDHMHLKCDGDCGTVMMQ